MLAFRPVARFLFPLGCALLVECWYGFAGYPLSALVFEMDMDKKSNRKWTRRKYTSKGGVHGRRVVLSLNAIFSLFLFSGFQQLFSSALRAFWFFRGYGWVGNIAQAMDGAMGMGICVYRRVFTCLYWSYWGECLVWLLCN
ncbi:hypothetical protein B0J14DRAFT_19621 [Halenospora varia]|nr:hypothetical protein B0J14DRAFT_19621 [Halenospora varia]